MHHFSSIATYQQPLAETSKITFRSILHISLYPHIILPLVLHFHPFQMLWLPVKPYEPRDQELCAVFRRFRESLMEEHGIADGSVENTVEDVGECFTLVLES